MNLGMFKEVFGCILECLRPFLMPSQAWTSDNMKPAPAMKMKRQIGQENERLGSFYFAGQISPAFPSCRLWILVVF
jgi:hypothetical protein